MELAHGPLGVKRDYIPMQQDNETIAFSTDQIGRFLGGKLIGDQRLNQLLCLVVNSETLKGLFVPGYIGDPINLQIDLLHVLAF